MRQVKAHPQNTNPNRQEKPRLLVVDDDTDFVSDLTVMLSSEFDIASASSTSEAYEKWLAYHPDCVLLDLQLPEYFGDNPEIEGLSFLSHMKSDHLLPQAGNIPVVLVSAHVDENTGRRAAELGIADVYRKPPNIAQLKATIRHLLTGREDIVS